MPRSLPFTILLVLLAAQSPAATAAPPQATDCFADLMRGASAELACDLPLKPSAAERAELEKVSRGYLKDLTCSVSIRIPRSAVTAAIESRDHDFVSPAHPVHCEVTAHLSSGRPPSVMAISATFAPTVRIRDGKAIDATPGLGDVKGVSRALSWPVETWVNSGIGIKADMLQVINAWLDHMRHTGSQSQARR